MIEPQHYTHIKTGTVATQIPIYSINEWRESTEEEIKWYKEEKAWATKDGESKE